MASARCPQTPRQKLIGMMYLFLTAMLALNISDKVLNAFVLIDDSLTHTREILTNKNEVTYRDIARQAIESPAYDSLNQKAQIIERRTNELVTNIERIKLMMIHGVGEEMEEVNVHDIRKIDELNIASVIMHGERGPRMGDSLRKWMEDYRGFMLDHIDEKYKDTHIYNGIKEALATVDFGDAREETWQARLALGTPLIGSIALLSKLQTDIKNVEADLLEHLIMDIEGGVDIRITSLEGIVSAPQGFIVRGGQYRANIFLGARDSTMDPLIYIRHSPPYWRTEVNERGDTVYKLLEGDPSQNYDTIQSRDGYAQFIRPATHVGNMEYGGLIMYQTMRGIEYYPFKGNYTVGDAGFTISATSTAVFYRGLDNPVEVSVSGYPQESVRVSISGGARIRQVSQGYIVNVPENVTADEVSISVSVTTSEGVRNLGSQRFRVLNVPPPSILVSGAYRDGASIPRAALNQNPFLGARLEADFFPFEGVSYEVIRFDFLYSIRGVQNQVTVSGNRFTPEVMEQITRMGVGQALSFTNIFVRGPSGTRQTQGVNVILR